VSTAVLSGLDAAFGGALGEATSMLSELGTRPDELRDNHWRACRRAHTLLSADCAEAPSILSRRSASGALALARLPASQ
jgi:hypothetical protein